MKDDHVIAIIAAILLEENDQPNQPLSETIKASVATARQILDCVQNQTHKRPKHTETAL